MSALRAQVRLRFAPTLVVAERWRELSGTWSVFWRSRLLVWGVGWVAVLVLGTAAANVHEFDATGISTSLGHVGNILAAPAVRWDSIWYLRIARDGYSSAQQAGFFPLYPLLIRLGSLLTGSDVIAGILLSFVACFVALELIRRLTALDLGDRVAGATVQLIAFGPMALFLTAVYTESLFLALSAGTLYAARRGRWAVAGVLGGLAAMTRVGGVLLFAPVVVLFFYGPRCDAAPAWTGPWWRPRYRFTPAVLWSSLIPVGLMLFAGYLALRGFGSEGTLDAQQRYWAHQVVMPFTGLWEGIVAAWREVTLELRGVTPPLDQSQAILQFSVLIAAIIALVGVFRRLPPAYGIWIVLDLLMHLSSPTIGQPLRGLDRYVSLRFPLFMVVAAWALERGVQRRLVIASALMLALFAAQFATWQWVAYPVR